MSGEIVVCVTVAVVVVALARRSGGLGSRRGPGGRTKAGLYAEAEDKNIKGHSKMTKAELLRAVGP